MISPMFDPTLTPASLDCPAVEAELPEEVAERCIHCGSLVPPLSPSRPPCCLFADLDFWYSASPVAWTEDESLLLTELPTPVQ